MTKKNTQMIIYLLVLSFHSYTYVLRCFLIWGLLHCANSRWGTSATTVFQVILIRSSHFHIPRELDISYTKCLSFVLLHELLHMPHFTGGKLVALGRVLIVGRQLLCQLLLPVLRAFRASHGLLLLGEHLHVLLSLNQQESYIRWHFSYTPILISKHNQTDLYCF